MRPASQNEMRWISAALNSPIVINEQNQPPVDFLNAGSLCGEILLEIFTDAVRSGRVLSGQAEEGYFITSLSCINTVLVRMIPGLLLGRTEHGLQFYIDDNEFGGIQRDPRVHMNWSE